MGMQSRFGSRNHYVMPGGFEMAVNSCEVQGIYEYPGKRARNAD